MHAHRRGHSSDVRQYRANPSHSAGAPCLIRTQPESAALSRPAPHRRPPIGLQHEQQSQALPVLALQSSCFEHDDDLRGARPDRCIPDGQLHHAGMALEQPFYRYRSRLAFVDSRVGWRAGMLPDWFAEKRMLAPPLKTVLLCQYSYGRMLNLPFLDEP